MPELPNVKAKQKLLKETPGAFLALSKAVLIGLYCFFVVLNRCELCIFKNALLFQCYLFWRAPFPCAGPRVSFHRFISQVVSLADNGNDVGSPSRWRAVASRLNSNFLVFREFRERSRFLDWFAMNRWGDLSNWRSEVGSYLSLDDRWCRSAYPKMFRIQATVGHFGPVSALWACHLLSAPRSRPLRVTDHRPAWTDCPIRCPYWKKHKIKRCRSITHLHK